MDEPIELHDGVGYTDTTDKIPDASRDDENEHMKINTLAETMTESMNDKDNAIQKIDKVDVSKPGTDDAAMRRLKIFCGILLALVIISSGTSGALIHTLRMRADATEIKSEDLQAKINQLQFKSGALTGTDVSDIQDLQTKWQEIESKTEVNMAKYDADLLVHSSKITQLEKDRSFLMSLVQDHTSRITRHETEITASNDTIHNLDARISRLEIDVTPEQRNIQALNSTITQLALDISTNNAKIHTQDTQITQLQSERTVDQKDIKTLNNSITRIESEKAFDRATIKDLNNSIIRLETVQTSMEIIIQNLTSRILQLEANERTDLDTFETLNKSIVELESRMATDSAAVNFLNSTVVHLEANVMEMHNNSLMQLVANLTSQGASISNNTLRINQINADWGEDHNFLGNLSSRIAIIEFNRLTDISTIASNSRRLSQLELGKNDIDGFQQNHEIRLDDLEVGLNCSWGNWTSFSSCSATCGEGIQYQERRCESLNPDFSGKWCSRKEIDIQICSIKPCPVNGGWGDWNLFSECSKLCGGGTQLRNRSCDNPRPSHGGADCSGDAEETRACNTEPCPGDCSELDRNNRDNGTYDIYPYGNQGANLSVYCVFDMDGTWTVIQKRFNGAVNFTRSWADYKSGFGNGNGEYWIGNDALHKITSVGNYSLKVVLTDWDGVTKYAMYRIFRVANEADGYRLTVSEYSGDAGDGMTEEGAKSINEVHNGMQFSTIDRDNDKSGESCATEYKGGWWYNTCINSNLNAPYSSTASVADWHGILWYQWRGYGYSLKETAMMIRKN